MNKQPVYYMQTDSRWGNVDYSTKGESTTIAKSGCGPTCAAMLIETLTGKTFTPKDACAWALKKGYKACNQGTYYSYFVPQFTAYGLTCKRINGASIYGSSTAAAHKDAFDLLKEGWYLIACMGKGTWTSSGHYIVVWWEDGTVRINDPASTKTERVNGDLATFKKQVKYYWAIDAQKYNGFANTPSATTSKGGNTVNITLPILKKGSKGESVKALQILLNGFGYDCGKADGSFGANTDAALRKYQKAMKLTVDGSCGANTWKALLS